MDEPPPPAREEPRDVTADAKANAKAEGPTLFQRARAAPVTFGLAATNVAVFVLAGQPGWGDEAKLLAFGAVEPLHVWAGEYWRVATCMFLHIGWIHLGMNTYASIGWATSLEQALGKARFLSIYLCAGVAGGCASVISGLLFGPHLSAGASGALFGIVGATLALRLRRLGSLRAFFADPPVRSTLIQLAIWTALGFTLHFDNAAHGGGFVVGAVLATFFAARVPRFAWGVFAAGFAVLLVVAAQPWWSPSGEQRNDVAIYARSYLTGTSPHGKTDEHPWPANIARGMRLGEKGCAHGVAYACVVVADHLDRAGEQAARSQELRRRACELEPASCQQVR